MSGQWDELVRLSREFAKPTPTTLKMSHGGYEYLRDEIPVASDRLRLIGLPTPEWTGLKIIVDESIPPDRIVVVDQFGQLLDVILLASSSSQPGGGSATG